MARQLFDINLASIINDDSSIAVGAKLYFYEADGVTLATTYTTNGGMVQNANPMLAQADGRLAQQVWLNAGEYAYLLTGPSGSPASPLFTGNFISVPVTGDDGASLIGTASGDTVQQVLDQKADADFSNADFTYPTAQAAQAFPYYNFRTQRRNLADFIDKAQWANIRDGVPTVATTNGSGVDSLTAAITDMAGAVGGEVSVPDGYFRIAPQTVSMANFTISGNGRSSVIQSTAASGDHFTIGAVRCTVDNLTFVSTQVRTGGAYVRVLLAGERFDCSNLTAFGAYTLLQIDGDPVDPTVQGGVYNVSNLLAESTVIGGLPYVVNGGYVVNMDNIRQIGDGTATALNGPAAGILITRCADLRIGGNSQFLNCQYAMKVIPPVGAAVDSLSIEGSYFGTSYYGSLITGSDGGSVRSFQATNSWFGENLDSGGGTAGSGPGLSIIGAAASRINTVNLIGCAFPLAQGNGLSVDQYARSVQVMGGWADGCGQSGYAFNGTTGFSLIGARSGAERFGGNGFAYYIDPACNYFRVSLNDFSGNTSASSAPATSATKIYTSNIT